MPWHSNSPSGSISVKANRTPMNENTTYIEETMGNSVVGTNTASTRDHFWHVSGNVDGRHRFIQSPQFTVGGVATDPVIGTGMDGVQYIKLVNSDVGRVEGFYRNTQGIYQHIPSFLQNSNPAAAVVITSTSNMTDIVAIPKNVYGEVIMFTTAIGKLSVVKGYFRSNGTTCEGWSEYVRTEGSTSPRVALRFGNGSDASGLYLRAACESAATNLSWFYRITYRAL